MSDIIDKLVKQINEKNLSFSKKPLLIGGMAMEYYGMRKAGADIDLIICDEDYQSLAIKYPDNRKDIWGDLGVVIEPFEIWRCIRLMDYDFYKKEAIDEGSVYVVSLDRLLLMRVLACGVPKYMDDLKLMEIYYMRKFENKDFVEMQTKHINSYKSANGGIIWGGKYMND